MPTQATSIRQALIFTNVGHLTAGSGATDTLVGVGGSTVDSLWTLGGTNSGTYSNYPGPVLAFSGFNTLQGSATSGGDVFDVNAAFSGSLKGGGSTSL